MNRDSDEFVTLLTATQPSLYAAILALLPDRAVARDLLQETNLTLWHKADDFEPGTNFLAWACRIARYHILNYRRGAQRERLVFDDELFIELADRQAARVEEFDVRGAALRGCLDKLPSMQRKLVEERYAPGGSVQRIAEAEGKSVGAISQTLYRVRETLLNCVRQALAQEAGA